MDNEKLPNLICPGAMKSGTTTLYEVLRRHPQIYMEVKEPHFFSLHFDRGMEYYKSLFQGAEDEKYIADMTPVYMLLDDVPKLMKDTLGSDLKFVFILRNPVDRAYSAYWMKRLNMRDNINSFEEALACEDERITHGKMPLIDYSYKTRGLYAKQIKNFLKYFPIENFHFIIFEDFIKDMKGESIKFFNFLGIDSDMDMNYDFWVNKPTSMKHPRLVIFMRKVKRIITKLTSPEFTKNYNGWVVRFLKRKVLAHNKDTVSYSRNIKTCRKLMLEFTDDISELEKIIGRDLSIWTDKYKEQNGE